MKLTSRLIPAGLALVPIVLICYLAAPGTGTNSADIQNEANGQQPAEAAADGDAEPPPERDTVTISPSTVSPDDKSLIEFPVGSRRFLTSRPRIAITAEIASDSPAPLKGTLSVSVNSVRQQKKGPTEANKEISLDVELREGPNVISVEWTPDESARRPASPATLFVSRDSVGPILQHAEVIDVPATGITLIATFADDDFDENTFKDAFEVKRQNRDGDFEEGFEVRGTPEVVGRTVRLSFASLPAGAYKLTVNGKNKASALKDILGNHAHGNATDGANKDWPFSVLPERKFGEHIEFPPYAPPTKQAIPPEGYNPADYVTTRVARLYYYRDAVRVAQIINRNVRSYNQAAVDQAERRAEQARDEADDATDKRREVEREAVRAAQQSRNAESKLAGAHEVLAIARQLDMEVNEKKTRRNDITKQLKQYDDAKKEVDVQQAAVTSARNALTQKERDLAVLQANAISERNQLATVQQKLASKRLSLQEEMNKVTHNDALIAQWNTEINALEADEETAAARKAEADRAVAEKQPDVTKAQETLRDAETEWQKRAAKADEIAARVRPEELRAEKDQLDLEVQRLENRQVTIGNPDDLEGTIKAMENNVAGMRQTEIAKQEAWDESEAREARAREKQFREETAAAEEDSDTYVAGRINSEDPVTQVSISVIGEGLIQLRGPIKGINKIRTMINQIDSPVGQIKNGILTVQVNGEKGDRMERVVGRIEGHIDLGRFLTNQSLSLLRRAIQTEAAMIAEQSCHGGHYQVDRDRKYLYAFFGRDFIDELYAMDSEFLRSENTLLSLHSMDTVSLNRALFVLALAKNDARQSILARFQEAAKTDLADAEYDFRRSSELRPHTTQKLIPIPTATHLPFWNRYRAEEINCEAVHRNAMQRYHFRNIRGFFDTGFGHADTINPVQREFIKLAQIFKSRMIAELEWKQRVMERGLIEDRSNDDNYRFELLQPIHREAMKLEAQVQEERIKGFRTNAVVGNQIEAVIVAAITSASSIRSEKTQLQGAIEAANDIAPREQIGKLDVEQREAYAASLRETVVPIRNSLESTLRTVHRAGWTTATVRNDAAKLLGSIKPPDGFIVEEPPTVDAVKDARAATSRLEEALDDTLDLADDVEKSEAKWQEVRDLYAQYREAAEKRGTELSTIVTLYHSLQNALAELAGSGASIAQETLELLDKSYASVRNDRLASARLDQVRYLAKETRADLDHRKLLDHLIDEQEDKFIELVEGTRSHIAAIDSYLKRLAIALEDDFKVQFYDPAFVRIRDAAREHDVNLGQVERTTILTNNRAFAKVSPQATMEFDLPKRQVAIKEAFDAAKALVEDTGALVNDPTFLAAFQMMGGSMLPATVKNAIPGLPSSTDQQTMGLAPQPASGGPGAALQGLVPEPSIFKIETGTGFEIRPVIQPDGDAVVYDFNYMYTTNVREPVRADEKHLGRVKRHFVHTQVQTSSFELREISRYQVALKVSRTSRGVPLLEDIPIVGAAFRPAPSDDSSIQQNIILGQTTVYPTLFDLMGLRWAPHVVDLSHVSLLDSEHVVRGRRKTITDFVFDEASRRVDEFLDTKQKTPDHYRPDLYHRHGQPSPHHPGGYFYPRGVNDPSGNGFRRVDRRPPEIQDPPYNLYRHQPAVPEAIGPATTPESVPPSIMSPSPVIIDSRTEMRRLDAEQANWWAPPDPSNRTTVRRASWNSAEKGRSDGDRGPRRLPPVDSGRRW